LSELITKCECLADDVVEAGVLLLTDVLGELVDVVVLGPAVEPGDGVEAASTGSVLIFSSPPGSRSTCTARSLLNTNPGTSLTAGNDATAARSESLALRLRNTRPADLRLNRRSSSPVRGKYPRS
jgi:hypothetical protein